MMPTSITISPPNSIIFIADVRGGEIPNVRPISLVPSTPSCIAIGCKMELDGKTEIMLGAMHDVDPGVGPTYEGKLETPSRAVAVLIVPGEKILEARVQSGNTHVRIWTNDSWEPDKIIIGLE